MATRAVHAIRSGLPGVFAVAVLVGMARTLAGLVATSAVDIGA
jgi:hypothetical protein